MSSEATLLRVEQENSKKSPAAPPPEVDLGQPSRGCFAL
ncbi:APOBEC1 complementation factor-like isoform 2 [Corchorus olitorius]|uniref:APOBEC1 complementation factor-like isoform 2 n=1 Tax=Corchorus olitorius TaxID=93759 RepID=A0A1R3K9E5_9ROSI|nr:APOBEC1 complementation factor-like isoform 2 [Corchorus olitorius]